MIYPIMCIHVLTIFFRCLPKVVCGCSLLRTRFKCSQKGRKCLHDVSGLPRGMWAWFDHHQHPLTSSGIYVMHILSYKCSCSWWLYSRWKRRDKHVNGSTSSVWNFDHKKYLWYSWLVCVICQVQTGIRNWINSSMCNKYRLCLKHWTWLLWCWVGYLCNCS